MLTHGKIMKVAKNYTVESRIPGHLSVNWATMFATFAAFLHEYKLYLYTSPWRASVVVRAADYGHKGPGFESDPMLRGEFLLLKVDDFQSATFRGKTAGPVARTVTCSVRTGILDGVS